MAKSSQNISIHQLLSWYEAESKTLRCTLSFQRHDAMWNLATKSNLIWSLLQNAYVPPVVLLRNKSGVNEKGKDIFIHEVLDGQQRLTSIFGFINSEFKLHADTPEVEVDGTVYDVAGLSFDELSAECQEAIRYYKLPVQMLEGYTMEQAESLFFSLNSGVPLNSAQKSKSKLGDELVSFLNELLGATFFKTAINVTERQIKAEDELLLLEQTMMLLDNRKEGREYKNISAASALEYASSIRGNYSEEKRKELAELVDYLNKAFTSRYKFLRKNNVPIVAVCALIAKEQGVKPSAFRVFIDSFSNGCFPEYDEASGSGNIKRVNVQKRLKVMFLEMYNYFGWDGDVDLPYSMPLSGQSGVDSTESSSNSDGESADGNAGVITGENAEVTENTLSSDGASEVEAETAGNEGEVQE